MGVMARSIMRKTYVTGATISRDAQNTGPRMSHNRRIPLHAVGHMVGLMKFLPGQII